MALEIIDPTATSRPASHDASATSPTLTSLRGLRVGLLENTKRNAAGVLAVIGQELRQHDGVAELTPMTKTNFALPLPDEMVEQIRQSCDAVIIGVGDCGSCSASAVADGIILDALGIPSAVICTDAFEVTANAMAKLKGRDDYAYIRTQHPIANLSAEQVDERGAELVDFVRAHLLRDES